MYGVCIFVVCDLFVYTGCVCMFLHALPVSALSQFTLLVFMLFEYTSLVCTWTYVGAWPLVCIYPLCEYLGCINWLYVRCFYPLLFRLYIHGCTICLVLLAVTRLYPHVRIWICPPVVFTSLCMHGSICIFTFTVFEYTWLHFTPFVVTYLDATCLHWYWLYFRICVYPYVCPVCSYPVYIWGVCSYTACVHTTSIYMYASACCIHRVYIYTGGIFPVVVRMLVSNYYLPVRNNLSIFFILYLHYLHHNICSCMVVPFCTVLYAPCLCVLVIVTMFEFVYCMGPTCPYIGRICMFYLSWLCPLSLVTPLVFILFEHTPFVSTCCIHLFVPAY